MPQRVGQLGKRSRSWFGSEGGGASGGLCPQAT